MNVDIENEAKQVLVNKGNIIPNRQTWGKKRFALSMDTIYISAVNTEKNEASYLYDNNYE